MRSSCYRERFISQLHPLLDVNCSCGTEEDRNVHEYVLASCPECDHPIDIDLSQNPRIIQQVNIVDAPTLREEHKAYAHWCENCWKHHYPDLPNEVIKVDLFMPKITASVAYMKNVCDCSFSNIRNFFRVVLHIRISRGYLAKVIGKVSKGLEGPYNA